MKLWNYMFIIFGLAFVMQIAGLGSFDTMLNFIGIDTSTMTFISSSLLFLAIFGVTGILIGIGVGVIIGTLTRSNPENYIILPLIVFTLSSFIGVIASVATKAGSYPSWISIPSLFILGLLGMGYLIACVEFFRGTD